MLLGPTCDGDSAFIASLGLKLTFAPRGISFPLNVSLRIFSQALPSSSLSMYSTANVQKHAGRQSSMEKAGWRCVDDKETVSLRYAIIGHTPTW